MKKLVVILLSACCLIALARPPGVQSPAFIGARSASAPIASGPTLGATTNINATVNSDQTYTFTTSGSSRYLLVGVSGIDPGAYHCTGVDYNGVSLTALTQSTNTVSPTATYSALYGLVAPASGANNLVFHISGPPGCGYTFYAQSWSGVNQSTPVGTAVKSSGNDTTPTVTASSASTEVVVDLVGVSGGGASTSPSGGQTLINANTNSAVSAMSYHTGSASTVMSWLNDNTRGWTIAAVPLKP